MKWLLVVVCALLMSGCIKIDGGGNETKVNITDRATKAAECTNVGGTLQYEHVNGVLEARCIVPNTGVKIEDISGGG